MKVIYKYELDITGTQSIKLYAGYKILSVQEQNGKLILWVVVNTDNNPQFMQIEIVGTGHEITEPNELFAYWEHISTVQMNNGLVWHVFDNKAPF